VSAARRVGHYVVSTHWDREWYESFQRYRYRLVNALDELLDTMKHHPEFRYFQTDGQSILIEDYLEVRPEREEELRALTAQGRLRIGPWYVLPDEFLVSGESIIRNIQMGMAVACRYGDVSGGSRIGFLCDLFGHISQLPQILRGFGIDNALLWRGCNESTHGALFRWKGADGSEVIAYRFSPEGGYCSWAFKVRHGIEIDRPIDMGEAPGNAREVIEYEMRRCPTPAFLVFDGGDHMEIEPRTPEILKRVNASLEHAEVVHSHLEGFVEDLREQRDHITRVFEGELRDPGEVGDDAWLIPGVLSSRIHLKQTNARCETELCAWAEPFSVFASGLGVAYPRRYIELAWRHLLQNHPHDSICGCSIDQVHKDMEYRFDQSLAIATRVTENALHSIAERVKLPELRDREFALVVFNPSSEPVDAPIDLMLRFPVTSDTYQEFFGFEPKIGFRLFGVDGQELPYQYVSHRRDRTAFRRPLRKFPNSEVRHEVDVSVLMKVPAFGYTTILCRPLKEFTRHLGSMQVDDHTIENEHLQVSVNVNGTISVIDKAARQTYDGLLLIEDRADIGDGWYHGVAVSDRIHSSIAATAEVALIADGIAKATLSIRVTLQVPEAYEFSRQRRSDRLVPLIVTHEVTLRRGARQVEVRSVVENTVRDHRVRVLFPTGAVRATTYLADQAFDVVERPIGLRPDNARYKELEVETSPQQTWTAVHDGKRGLAVVAHGLPETAVRDLPDRPIALTLLRSFLRAVFTSGNEGGQIQGTREFRFRIVPLSGVPDTAALCRLGRELGSGTRAVPIERFTHTGREVNSAPDRTLPATHSFLRVEGREVVVSAVHQHAAKEVATVRLFNPTSASVQGRIGFDSNKLSASRTDLEGRNAEPAGRQGVVEIALKPKEILTLRFNS
jgi:alpha-mannosidase/mannosylglycerate hydrolase